ncbi:M4 family metallopeptidase [Planococcus versutus]|uniref:Neutral metalloproteinase n=1 Tax=Planococcus versutus TaxID=1302659 RepID=A0A1B1RX71_9BACL|nr:M4 family metallopeptidase [Planococcus versutus]ANU25529.1 flagellar biosynthesis protein FlgM [Planococcus versutus]
MKRKYIVPVLLSSALVASSFTASATLANTQNSHEKVEKTWNEKANVPVFVKEKIAEKRAASNASNALDYLANNENKTGLKNARKNLKQKNTEKDSLGMTHVSFSQSVNDVPVEGAEVVVHYSKNDELVSVTGSHFPEAVAKSIDTTPTVSMIKAVQSAKNSVDAPDELEYNPTSELVVYPFDGKNHLTYKVNVNFLGEKPGNWFVFIDAKSGEVIDQYNAIMHANKIHQSVGTGVLGGQRKIHTTKVKQPKSGTVFSLSDESHEGLKGIYTLDANDGEIMINNSASWKDEYLRPGVDAHYNSEQVYEYFNEQHDRNSLDDNGMAIISYVHFGENYNNAFWNGRQMTYGDGDGLFMVPLSAGLDVAAHEMTHGVISNSANLQYRFESGALNESFADIFGTLVDADDWEIGEDIMGPEAKEDGRVSLRSLSDPSKYKVKVDYVPYGNGEGNYPSHMDEFYDLPRSLDNGGVHINSSITNHAAYLIGEEIGKEKLGKIFYRALTIYLTPTSNFSEARKLIVQSAVDIYGEGSAEVVATANGFDSVGIYE